MKAITITGKGKVALSEVKKPDHASVGHVIIKMKAMGINAGDKFLIRKEKKVGRGVLECRLVSEGARGFGIGHRSRGGFLLVVDEDPFPGGSEPHSAAGILMDVTPRVGGGPNDPGMGEGTIGLGFDARQAVTLGDPVQPGCMA